MIIDVNTDSHLKGSDAFNERCKAATTDKLKRFDDFLSRVVLHFSDENGAKHGTGDDKKCTVELRVKGKDPMAVTANAGSLDHALALALDKAKNALTTITDQLKKH